MAARYDVERLRFSRLTGFTATLGQDVIETFTHTTGTPLRGLKLSVSAPPGWSTVASEQTAVTFPDPIAPGASVSATFRIKPPDMTTAGFLTGKAEWKGQIETTTQRIRSSSGGQA